MRALFLSTGLPVIESIVNRALQADPDALKTIAALQHQVIEVHCTDWEICFFILIDSRGLQFYQHYSNQTNTQIYGTLNHFLHLFIKGADTKAVFQYPVEIIGNTHNVEVIRHAFKNIDIDFEEKCSHFLGDALAHKLFHQLKKTKKILEKSTKNICDQTKEFIHCETKSLVSKKQAEQFYRDVARLRDDVERLEAKIKSVQTK